MRKSRTKEEINIEIISVYEAIIKTMGRMKTDRCQSWWLTAKDNTVNLNLTTQEVNRRCKTLIKNGYLKINDKYTSTSTGVSYMLTDKKFLR